MKRSRAAVVTGGLQFYVVTKSGDHHAIEPKVLSKPFEALSEVDNVDYGLYFRPPIRSAKQCTLYATLADDNTVFFSTPLYPRATPSETMRLMDRVYAVFETHQLSQSEDETMTYAVYIQFDTGGAGKPQPSVDMTLHFFAENFGARFKRVPYFPYDVDPAQYGLKVNSRQISQRTPLWFKLRGEVSGSVASKYVGFWVPSKAKAPNWSIDNKEVFSAQSRANMRMGTLSEEYAIMLLLMNTPPTTAVELVGYCDAPHPPYPYGYGASPDGLLSDTAMTWESVPESIRQHLDCAAFDPTRGVLEIKSSTKSLNMEAYFYPQVYMEMISTNTCWCDLVRYCKSSDYDGEKEQWTYEHTARVYRIYRHMPTEQILLALIKRAHANKANLQEIVQDESYRQIRAYFTTLAKSLPYREISITDDNMFQSYDAYKRQAVGVAEAVPPGGAQKRPKIDTLHEQIKEAPTPELIAEQMKVYMAHLLTFSPGDHQ